MTKNTERQFSLFGVDVDMGPELPPEQKEKIKTSGLSNKEKIVSVKQAVGGATGVVSNAVSIRWALNQLEQGQD